jgi:6-phosphogluconolactonase
LFHPNGRHLFVVAELTAEVRSYSWDAKQGRLQLTQTLAPYPADGKGNKSAGELVLSRDGRYLYVSLRGDQDKIVVYAVNAKQGTLSEIQRVSSIGKTPWSMALDPSGRWLLVTNEVSSSLNVLRRDVATGLLSATDSSLSIPKPVTLAFYPAY